MMDEVLCTNMVWKWEKQLLTGTARVWDISDNSNTAGPLRPPVR